MNSVSRQRRASRVAMIVGGLLAVAPVFGPLSETLHYLADFFAELPQSMRGPDIHFTSSCWLCWFGPSACSYLPQAGVVYPKRPANRAA